MPRWGRAHGIVNPVFPRFSADADRKKEEERSPFRMRGLPVMARFLLSCIR
jgi:hypothetical protein